MLVAVAGICKSMFGYHLSLVVEILDLYVFHRRKIYRKDGLYNLTLLSDSLILANKVMSAGV